MGELSHFGPSAADRVMKTEPPGVQRDRFATRVAILVDRFVPSWILACPIPNVADDRVAAMGGLHAELVHAARFGGQFDQRPVISVPEDANGRDRLLRVGRVSDDFGAG
jgi:hypothetical protein